MVNLVSSTPNLPPSAPLRLAALDDEPGRLLALQRYAIIDSGTDPQFDKIVALVRDVLDVPIATVSLIDRDRQWFKAKVGIDGVETDRRSAFCDHTIRAREVMIVEDATLDPRFAENMLVTGAPHIRAYAGAPLMTPDGYNLGALCAIDRKPRSFTASQLGVLQRFSALVVEEIELRSAVQHDYLTGALTRRAFVDGLANAVVRHAIDRSDAALVTFDIDHFKSINDSYGHPTGDKVLQAVVAKCRSRLRAGHALGRMGGEEFAILLPGAGPYEAEACAERMRVAVAAVKVPGCSPVTASFGIASLQTGDHIDQWLAAADSALYAVKRGGRNRCVVAPGDDTAVAA